MKLVECIANVSEGKNLSTIEAITSAIKNTEQVHLLHVDRGESANRTVFTFAGELEFLFKACRKLLLIAHEQIDMRNHTGSHPRIGAVDVCPFVALSGISKQELILEVESFAEGISNELGLGIYLYEDSAKLISRRNLAFHRQGEYEKLEHRIQSGIHPLDYGKFQANFGACVMGVRNFLLAYNINLVSKDLGLAKKIAYSIRSSGWPEKVKKDQNLLAFNKLKHVKAIAWEVPEYNLVQVSTNLTDYSKTGMHQVYELIKKMALKLGTNVAGSELIGLVPLEAILNSGQFYAQGKQNEEKNIKAAIKHLGLSSLESFVPEKRILEYCMRNEH